MNAEDRCFCELAPLYALNLLDEDDRCWVEAQAIDHPELATELAEHQATVNALPYSIPAVPMATDLKERLFQRLAEEPAQQPVQTPDASPLPLVAISTPFGRSRQGVPTVNAAPTLVSDRQEAEPASVVPMRRHRVMWLQTAGAIAAVAAIALLADNYHLRQSAQADRAIVAILQQPNSIAYTLRGTEKAANASGSLVVNASEKTAIVLVQNLPTLPAGKAYRLWAVPKGATKPIYCGQFNNTTSGTVRWSLPEAVCSANAPQMLITAESADAPPIPAGALVMKSTS